MQTNGLEKAKIQNLNDLSEYVSDSVSNTLICNEKYGNISITAIDKGGIIAEKSSSSDIFVQIIDGLAEIIIDKEPHILHPGQFIIIPAHSSNVFKAAERFKMISTTIKSGYEEGLR